MSVLTKTRRNNGANLGFADRLATMDAYEGIFLASYCVWLVSMLLLSTFFASYIGSGILNGMRYLGLFGAALSILMRGRHRAGEALGLFLLLALAYITTRTNAPVLLDLVVLVYCGRFVDFKIVARASLWITAIVLCLTIFAAEMGLIRNYVSISVNQGVARRREYLGFLYALQPAQLMFNITCIVVYLKGEKLSLPHVALLLAGNLLIYFKADGRLSFFISVVLVILAFLLRYRIGKQSIGRGLCSLAPLAFILIFVLCWYATVAYPGQIVDLHELNSALGGRLSLGHDALAKYGTTFFGQSISFVGNGLDLNGKINASAAYNYVDCLYIRLPILYGWLFTVLFLLGMTLVAVWAAKKRNYQLALILVAIAAHCVVDDLVIRLQFCTFLFLLGSCLTDVATDLISRRGLKREAHATLDNADRGRQGA